jgi:hypothetical protein
MTCTIERTAYHRNGICGAPFHTILFHDPDVGRMVGIVFDEPYHVAVVNIDKLFLGDIAFGSNSWRGDHYEPMLRAVIRESSNDAEPPEPVVPVEDAWNCEYSPYHTTEGREVPAFEVFDADGTKLFDTNEDLPVDTQEAAAQLASAAPALRDALAECLRLLADHDDSPGEEGEIYRQGLAVLSRCPILNLNTGVTP